MHIVQVQGVGGLSPNLMSSVIAVKPKPAYWIKGGLIMPVLCAITKSRVCPCTACILPLIQMDETSMQVMSGIKNGKTDENNEKTKPDIHKGWMWLARGGPPGKKVEYLFKII